MTVKRIKNPSLNSEQLGKILKKLVDLVEKSSADEIESLLSESGELRIYRVRSKSRSIKTNRLNPPPDESYTETAKKLHSFQTREAGKRLLGNTFSTKHSIENFARFLDLPVHRRDTIAILTEKIIESEIGSRLRSEAVQGKSVQISQE